MATIRRRGRRIFGEFQVPVVSVLQIVQVYESSSGTTSVTVSITGGQAGSKLIILDNRRSGETVSSLTVDGNAASSLGIPRQWSFNSSQWFEYDSAPGGSYDVVVTYSGAVGVGGAELVVIELDGAGAAGTPEFYDDGTGSVTTSVDNSAVFAHKMHTSTPGLTTGYTAFALAATWQFNRGEYNTNTGTAGVQTADGAFSAYHGVAIAPA